MTDRGEISREKRIVSRQGPTLEDRRSQRDMAHKDEIHEVIQSKYTALMLLVEVREGSDGEL